MSIWIFMCMAVMGAMSVTAASGTGLAYRDLAEGPDVVWAVGGGLTNVLEKTAPDEWRYSTTCVRTAPGHAGLRVWVEDPGTPLETVVLRWTVALPESARLLGDAWERSYGDLAWRTVAEARPMPWYFLVTDGRVTHGYGVAVQPGALCCWTADPAGVTLTLDVRAGGTGVRLGDRTLEACTVVGREGLTGETPFAAGRAFCGMMCPKPKLPKEPVYGFNDWYCAYGNNTDTNFLADAALIASLAPEGPNRPYLVVDDGWQVSSRPGQNGGCGPWDRTNARFSMGMPELARRVKALNARPGLWYRPLFAWPGLPNAWRQRENPDYMDPSVPEVRRQAAEDIARFRAWGFQLVKVDFLTYDICGLWGFQLGDRVIHDARVWADTRYTTAETILAFYRAMRQAAEDDVIVIGCNALSHLVAGVFEMQRIGDDTSGREWARTRTYGINTLAFRGIQDRTFYAADADCVGLASAGAVPWEMNRQWLDLVARSGTPLFVSWRRELAGPEVRDALRGAFRQAARVAPTVEPLDWMETLTPARWRSGDGDTVYHWNE